MSMLFLKKHILVYMPLSVAERASAHTDNKQDAIDRAREIRWNQGTELIVHNTDGKIALA